MIGYTFHPETRQEEIRKASLEFIELKNHIDRIRIVGDMFGWDSEEMKVTRAAYREWQQERRVSHVDNDNPRNTIEQQSLYGSGV